MNMENLKKRNFKIVKYFKTHYYNWKFTIYIMFILVFSLLIIDNATKIYAINHLPSDGTPINFIPGFIDWELVNNAGSAYGHNSNHLGLAISLAILVTIIVVCFFIFMNEPMYIISLGVILGGDFGNLINRIWNNGMVTDFISWNGHFIFNFADACVSIGLAMLFISIITVEFILEPKYKKRESHD